MMIPFERRKRPERAFLSRKSYVNTIPHYRVLNIFSICLLTTVSKAVMMVWKRKNFLFRTNLGG